MTEFKFLNIDSFLLFWILPLLVALIVYSSQKRRRMLKKIVSKEMAVRLVAGLNVVGRRWKRILILLALVFLGLALTRPVWKIEDTKIERRGRDVIFILDVSKSMLATDIAPNRLERAKIAIADCVDVLQGDRVGLIAFAGVPVLLCPLTIDYGFFKMILEDVSVDSVPKGGTMIGDAIRKALDEGFSDEDMKSRHIVLITDGADHASFPLAAAEQAGEKGVRLIAVGLGDENDGQRIPIVDEHGVRRFMMHEGKEVWTRLDADSLRKMVRMTPDGVYLNVATGDIDLGSVYIRLSTASETRRLEYQTIRKHKETFQFFVGIALVLMVIEPFIRERKVASGFDEE